MDFKEKFLYHIWDQRHLLPELKTVSGKSIKISYQGRYNTSNGPDFKNASFTIGDTVHMGDVEIHQQTYDWISHNHDEDPVYNDTLLHVVYEHKGKGEYTIREDGHKIEILELKNHIDNDIAKLLIQYNDYTPNINQKLCDYFSLSSSGELHKLMFMNGWNRFLRRSNRYNTELLNSGFDQLIYNGLMEASGYDKNKENMLTIAHHFSWDKLRNWVSEGLDSVTLASIWLNYSDMLYNKSYGVSDTIRAKLIRAFEIQSFTAEKGNINWNLFRIRPANHPATRIIQASIIIIPLLKSGFLNTLIQIFSKDDSANEKSILNRLTMLFKGSDQTLNVNSTTSKNQILSLTGNVILPILYIYAQKTNDKIIEESVSRVFYNLPKLEKNYVIRHMQSYLTENQQKIANSNFSTQQGLHHIFYTYCNYKMCEMCIKNKKNMIHEM